MNNAIVSLGSNLNPEKYIPEAKAILSKTFNVLKESAFLFTEPIQTQEKVQFLNGSILLETKINLADFRKQLKDIEQSIQKMAVTDRITNRVIDLDLTVWNGKVVDQDYYKRSYLKKAVDELNQES